MEKVNNKNGIEMYYEINETLGRFEIYDSEQNYFNDLCLEEEDYKTNFVTLIKTLEETDLNEMCSMFGHKIYDKLHKLAKEQDIDDKEFDPLENEYVNVFSVNGKTLYTWCWG